MNTITIPKNLIQKDDLVIIPRREYEKLINLLKNTKIKKGEIITEKNILQWSREAKKLNKTGKLPLFKNLIKKNYPKLATKYHL